MFPLCSFLQSLFRLGKAALARNISYVVRLWRQTFHQMGVMAAGAIIVTLMTVTLNGFAGGGRSALTVYAEVPQEGQVNASGNLEAGAGEAATLTEANVQFRFTDGVSIREGQALAGSMLAENIQKQEAARDEIRAVVEKAKEEIRKVEEQRALAAGEQPSGEVFQAASAAVSYSQQDYEVLKRIVEAEAGICDTKGRILVANVVLNRVRSSQFPNTITEVVYQRSQFSPVRDGRLSSCVVTPETVEAVDRALAGEDYSQGALYFMNRGRSRARNVSWFDRNLTYLFHHDRHEFYK